MPEVERRFRRHVLILQAFTALVLISPLMIGIVNIVIDVATLTWQVAVIMATVTSLS
jgi:lipopolysaccharide/colanic/teichoic acid biosynthesis glycosyltransferase